MRPLYDLEPCATLKELQRPEGNTGLWYDKFGDRWGKLEEKKERAEERLSECAWLSSDLKFDKSIWVKTAVTGTGNGSTATVIGEKELLEGYAHRRATMVSNLKGKNLAMTTASVFVTGLGREHPVENGMAWHTTLGTPFLPGSSVKGLVRAWVDEEYVQGEKESEAAKERDRIFGKLSQVGSVNFLDALPTEPIRLKHEIMTPHYSDYYQDKKIPGDWESPTPIPFLAVDAGANFHFALAPRRPDNARDQGDVETAARWLEEALTWLGAGAKTAVGYGRFTRLEGDAEVKLRSTAWSAQEDIERRQRLTPLERGQEKGAKMSEDDALDWVRETLTGEPGVALDDEEQEGIRLALKEKFYGEWAKGKLKPTTNISISASKLKSDYAVRFVSENNDEDEQDQVLAALSPDEQEAIVALNKVADHDKKNLVNKTIEEGKKQGFSATFWELFLPHAVEKLKGGKRKDQKAFKAFAAWLKKEHGIS
ncbi:type III-B CRISPR module RAMP protein Cmr6 [Lujinxingia vulgaris]|uniref:Type III-B CRISPR module RAMP protein Cmr6 n=1 Tax=Lujinxingia vulgaris TaxID=2600176 RepID=A0A5C6X3G8_9DELT|nr:type III-B CRISPR module RAMP protein Cmr6 [Lujinxingia vulgaris]TXD34084.1 type III-B CRISPR module RAMP protein Cmr6 [Lujinxingia vulgaris]